MKYRGCCSNCLLSHGETNIYKIKFKNRGYYIDKYCTKENAIYL